MAASVGRALRSRFLRRAEARTLRGRLVFCYSQVFGKQLGIPLTILRSFCEARGGGGPIQAELVYALRWIVHHLKHASPRVVKDWLGEPAFIFTDGAAEPDNAG